MSSSTSRLRRIQTVVVLVAGGVFFGAVSIAACCNSEPALPDPAIDGMKACIGWCELSRELCDDPAPGGTCEQYCENELTNAGAYCKGLVSQTHQCYLRELQAQAHADAGNLCDAVCQVIQADTLSCIRTLGCEASPDYCNENDVDAGHCACRQVCKEVSYGAVCDRSGMTFACDCYIDNTLVGTCHGGAEAVCDWRLRNGCCNQYFSL